MHSEHKPLKTNFIIASHRSWNLDMAERLKNQTGHHFTLIREPDELKLNSIQETQPRYIFFPHWSYRIPEEIFQNFECVIFHMTDLPFGRGGSPLQNLIQRGIYETNITALRCVKELDAGPIYLKSPLSLHGSAEEIFIRGSRIVEEMIVQIINDNPEPIPQQGEPVSFKRRKPQQSSLADTNSLEEVFDKIRMLDAEGYPHAFLDIGCFRLEFTRASLKTDSILADVRIILKQESGK